MIDFFKEKLLKKNLEKKNMCTRAATQLIDAQSCFRQVTSSYYFGLLTCNAFKCLTCPTINGESEKTKTIRQLISKNKLRENLFPKISVCTSKAVVWD